MWRYFDDLGGRDELHVNWSDRNQNSKIVTISDESTSSINHKIQTKLLFKTVVQISDIDASKLITITLFYSTGTLLVQGHASPLWTMNEYQNIIKRINHLKNNNSASYQGIISSLDNSIITTIPDHHPLSSSPIQNPDTNYADEEVITFSDVDHSPVPK